jgi:uncharacterized membrane protein
MTTARAYGAVARRPRPGGWRLGLPWVLTVAFVAVQIAYPLVDGDRLRWVTIASVVLFFLASVSHAWVHRGAVCALSLVAIAGGGGLVAEAVGVRTGVPFGDYAYSGSLGPQVLDVPLVVPLAWTMMAYPVLLAARRVTRRYVVPLGAVGLAGWDVFLDPQMVADGRWRWTHPTPALPGVPHVPLTNYAGWLLVALVLMGLLVWLVPRDGEDETVPGVLLAWTYVGSVVGNLLWFGTPSIALAGGLAMGLLVLPWAWAGWQSRP